MCVDMHIHTTASDGVLTPTQIIEWGVKLGLEGVSITDHDTVTGIDEAIESLKRYNNFIMIPGIEFSTLYSGREIHLLGYGFDHKNTRIIELTNEIMEARLYRGNSIVKNLIALGFEISYSEVLDFSKGGVVGRPHIARVLLKKGYVASIQQAFNDFLNEGTPGYVERFKLPLKEAIDVIKVAGGLSVLAHPGLLNDNINIHELIELGIQGIEVFHSKHSVDDVKHYLKIAKKYNLLITGGTDYHDTFNNNIPTLGSISVPKENILKLVNKCYNKFIV